MTAIRHHLTDSLLIAYSAGALPEAFNLAIATHVTLCDDCRIRLEGFEAVGGAVLDRCDTAALNADSLAATLRLISSDDFRKEPASAKGDMPAPLADYAGPSLNSVRWRPLGMGVRQAILPTDSAASARLLYIPAGQAVPDHGHRGTELTLVLKGAFRDETDRFGPGDIEIADQALTHTPVAEAGEPCICLAVTDAPLRFKGVLPRLVQRFARI